MATVNEVCPAVLKVPAVICPSKRDLSMLHFQPR